MLISLCAGESYSLIPLARPTSCECCWLFRRQPHDLVSHVSHVLYDVPWLPIRELFVCVRNMTWNSAEIYGLSHLWSAQMVSSVICHKKTDLPHTTWTVSGFYLGLSLSLNQEPGMVCLPKCKLLIYSLKRALGCVALCYDCFSEKPKLSHVELG